MFSKMKNSTIINLLNEYVVFKNQSLGKGATGEVYVGKSLKDISSVAVKVIDNKTIDNEVTEYLLNMEKTALMTVNNPYILKGIKVIQDHLNCYLVTELCNGGTLKANIKDNGLLSEEKSVSILIQILKGECSLIEKGILHRDLKPANILMHNGHVKIIDFGYCQIKGYRRPELDYNVGSPSYMSPEAFLTNQYSEKSEVWAAGVTFYQCLTGRTIDQGRNMAEVYKQLKKNGIPYKISVSQRSKTIIRWCLQADSKNRPTCEELLNFITPKSLQKSDQRSSTRSLKISFTSPQNLEFKSSKMLERMGSSKQILKLLFSIDDVKKEDVLKKPILESKIHPVKSTYEPKQIIIEEKDINQSINIKELGINKNQKKLFVPQFKKPCIRPKYLPYQPQNVPNYCLNCKLGLKDEALFNPIKAKLSSRPSFYQSEAIKVGVYGKLTQR